LQEGARIGGSPLRTLPLHLKALGAHQKLAWASPIVLKTEPVRWFDQNKPEPIS
jgi:hypothetical protein